MTIPSKNVTVEQIGVAQVQVGDIVEMVNTINANFAHLTQSPTFRGIPGVDGNDGNIGETGTRGTQIYTENEVPTNTSELIDGDLKIGDNGILYRWNGTEFEATNIVLLTTSNTYTKNEINNLLSGTISSIDTDSVFSIKKAFSDVNNSNRLSIPDVTGNSAHDFVFIDLDSNYSFLIGRKDAYNNSVATANSGFSPLEGNMPKLIILQDNFEEGILLGRADTNFDDFATISVKEITSNRRVLKITHDELDIIAGRVASLSGEELVTLKSIDKYIYIDNTIFEIGQNDIEFRIISENLIDAFLDLNLNENILSFRYDSETNISHAWYDDLTGIFHFVSNDTRKAEGNATIKAGKLILADSVQDAEFNAYDKMPIGTVFMWCQVTGSNSITQLFDLSNPINSDYGIGLLNRGIALCNGKNGTVDLRGKFVAAYDPSSPEYQIKSVGGAHLRQLSVSNLPSHSHSGTVEAGGGHTHTMDNAGGHIHNMNGAGSHKHILQNSGGHNHSGFTGWDGLHNHNGRVIRVTNTYTTGSGMDSTTDGFEIDLKYWDAIGFDGYHRHPISWDGSHVHDMDVVADHIHIINSSGSHVHNINAAVAHTHNLVINSTGSGLAFDNRPEFVVLAYFQKIA